MKKPPRRERAVMFRVTPEEYRAIERSAEAAGARSLSQFVRERVLVFVNETVKKEAAS